MLPIVADQLDGVRAACLAYGVARLSLFGSAAGGAFDVSRSDLDFLVEFLPCTPAEHYERYFSLRETLIRLFAREVDLIEFSAMRNPYLIRRATETLVSLYAA